MRLSRFIFGFFVSLFFLVLLFGVFLSRSNIQVRSDITAKNHKDFYDYKGITHVVTKYSQGSGSPSQIISAASQANISFIFFTDLNDFDGLHEVTGYSQGVLVLPGKKISYLDSHLLFYSDESLKHLSSLGSSTALATDLLQRKHYDPQDPLLVLAHPYKKGFQWEGDFSQGLNGIEVMNLRHMWQQVWLKKKASFVWSLFLYVFNPKVALLRLINEPQKELQLWDQMNMDHKTIGVLGNHSMAKIFNLGFFSFEFPTYEQSFQFASNHILLESELTGILSRDRKKVYQALQKGNFYFSIDSLAEPKGFAAYMQDNNGTYLMGENIKLTKSLKLNVDLPSIEGLPYEIRIYRNGVELKTAKSLHTSLEITEPGNYRVYARLRLQFPIPGELRWVPWIYTNNFYVR